MSNSNPNNPEYSPITNPELLGVWNEVEDTAQARFEHLHSKIHTKHEELLGGAGGKRSVFFIPGPEELIVYLHPYSKDEPRLRRVTTNQYSILDLSTRTKQLTTTDIAFWRKNMPANNSYARTTTYTHETSPKVWLQGKGIGPRMSLVSGTFYLTVDKEYQVAKPPSSRQSLFGRKTLAETNLGALLVNIDIMEDLYGFLGGLNAELREPDSVLKPASK